MQSPLRSHFNLTKLQLCAKEMVKIMHMALVEIGFLAVKKKQMDNGRHRQIDHFVCFHLF